MSERWSPDQVVGYEAAGDVLHVLAALCTGRISREEARPEPDQEVIRYWRQVSADRTEQWRQLDPAGTAAVERFVGECRELVERLQGEQA